MNLALCMVRYSLQLEIALGCGASAADVRGLVDDLADIHSAWYVGWSSGTGDRPS